MKIKQLPRFGLACLLSISSLLVIALPQAHAINITCIWDYTGGGNDNFSNANNWQDCNGGAPTGNGTEELVFPVSSTVTPTANDDLGILSGGPTGGSLKEIQFTTHGTNTQGYSITGDPRDVGDITDQSSTTSGNELALNITLSGSQVAFSGNSSSQLI